MIALLVVGAGLILALPTAQGQVIAAKADGSAEVTPRYHTTGTLPSGASRVYLDPAGARSFIRDYLAFNQGRIAVHNRHVDGAEIGLPGTTFGEVLLSSTSGTALVIITPGALPYPFGRENTGYAVTNLTATLARATGAGGHVLWGPSGSPALETAIVQFPGGRIAEFHQGPQLARNAGQSALAVHHN
jgi:hypothetical protein